MSVAACTTLSDCVECEIEANRKREPFTQEVGDASGTATHVDGNPRWEVASCGRLRDDRLDTRSKPAVVLSPARPGPFPPVALLCQSFTSARNAPTVHWSFER